MTTDNFTEAARAEAERQYPALNPDAEELTYPRSALREHRRSAHVAGWEAARTYLAAQEPTDEECIYILSIVCSPFGEEDKKSEWAPAAIQRCREIGRAHV